MISYSYYLSLDRFSESETVVSHDSIFSEHLW